VFWLVVRIVVLAFCRPARRPSRGTYRLRFAHLVPDHRGVEGIKRLVSSPPSVHSRVKTLEHEGYIQRQSGVARSIKLLVAPETLPVLRRPE
jgi:hypothetical protein